MPHAPNTFVHLHNHTEFSLLDGASRIHPLVEAAAKLEMPALAITDHGVMYGAIHFYKACKEAGIKPIVGCEVYVAPRSRLMREGRVDRDPSHLTLLAANHEGYLNLMKLCTVGQMEGMYYKPRIDKEILAEHSAGLIALSGCLQGEIAGRIVDNDLEGAKESAATFRDIFTKDRFLLEVQRHGIEKQDRVNEALTGFGKEFGLRLCATNDLHYVHRHDSDAHDVLLCLQTGARFSDPNRWRFSTQENYLKTPEEMATTFADLPDALASTLDVADMCDLKLHLGATLLPPFDVPDGLSPDQYLAKLVADGLNWRYGTEPSSAAKDRATNELEVIKATGYASYFLIVWDFYNFARKHEIVVGPGRGSAAGSLVSYCLGITNLDPIQHGLIFERFLNIDRVSMPDIDCDFSVEGREKVIRYVSEKYGSDRVAQIITFTTMASKAAIRDVGRVLEVPLRDTDRLAKLIPVWQGRSKSLDDAMKEVPDLREAYESNEDQKRLIDVARALENVSRNVSTHAAGVVIAPEPLVRSAPLQSGPRKQCRQPIEFMHERREPILRETYGVMIYQEQVMMAARELAGFTMSEADILRAAMGKKDKAKMAKLRTKFIDGTVERGIPKSTAEALFDGIAKFAEYGFNRAHSAAYGVIAYQTAYLKANYPLEYMTALLIHMEGNAERVATAIVDCRLRGIDVLAPDIHRSRGDFSISDGRARFGLAAIKNVGQHAVESIVSLRDADGTFKSLEDLCERTSAIQH